MSSSAKCKAFYFISAGTTSYLVNEFIRIVFFLFLEFFTSTFADGLSLEFE